MSERTNGVLRAIYTAPSAGAPMILNDTAKAVAGRGINSDRYGYDAGLFSGSRNKKIRHVSLIEQEAIDAAASCLAIPYSAEETRRNLVTTGVKLNELVNGYFAFGDVVLRGTELCHPCRYPGDLSGKIDFKRVFTDRGGLRAEVITSGTLAVGASLVLLEVESMAV